MHLRHWIFGLESAQALERLEGTDLFYLVVEIPPLSRVEYKLEIRRGEHRDWIEDPRNPHRARDPFGANSVLATEGYAVPEWSREDPVARAGRLEPFSFNSRTLGGPRSGHIYMPARWRKTRRYPLLVVHDGGDYLNYAGMRTVLDNLIHRLEIPSLIEDEVPIRMAGYPIETVLAEKLVTALQRGTANTRWRDFGDVHLLLGAHDVDEAKLDAAIVAVADHRNEPIRLLAPVLDGFTSANQARWVTWRRRLALTDLLPEDFAIPVATCLTVFDAAVERIGAADLP